ncbi:MAG: PIN domain-containing protein [Leptolyngbya sp. SIO4C5]|nr:PIN domain-containing protein [Leptolyngbya sp. SIO4C5]
MTHSAVLIDTGVLVAFYDQADIYHDQVIEFLSSYRGRLITTLGCVTEVMWLLASDYRVQNAFLRHLSERIYECETLRDDDSARIAVLNAQYFDLPADFSDLALVAISERLNILGVATFDKDFDIYRRYRNQPFERAF